MELCTSCHRMSTERSRLVALVQQLRGQVLALTLELRRRDREILQLERQYVRDVHGTEAFDFEKEDLRA